MNGILRYILQISTGPLNTWGGGGVEYSLREAIVSDKNIFGKENYLGRL